jgi:hypothetical protein
MEIQKIAFKNFKLFRNKEIVFDGNTKIYGWNRTGKTTIVDGFTWLFFGKSSDGSSSANMPKPIIDEEVQHNLETSVTATINDNTYTRIFTEKYAKIRGSVKKEFTGHKTVYEYNDVVVTKKEFLKLTKEVVGDETMFHKLTSPTVIPSLKWEELRSLLMDDEPILEELNSKLDTLKGTRKKQNKAVDELPVRIDEAFNSLEEIDYDTDTVALFHKMGRVKKGEPFNEEEAHQFHLNNLKEKRDGFVSRRLVIERGEFDPEINKGLEGARTDLLNAQQEVNNFKQEHGFKFENNLRDWNDTLQAKNERLSSLRNDLRAQVRVIEDIDRQLQEKRVQYKAIQAETLDVVDVCFNCNQQLPEGTTESQQEDFNLNKSKRLSANVAEGKQVATNRKDAYQKSEDIEAKIVLVESDIKALNTKKPSTTLVVPDELKFAVGRAQGQVDLWEGKLSQANKGDKTSEIAEIDEEISVIDASISELNKISGKKEAQQYTKDRIAELREELSLKAEALATTEQKIFEVEEQIKSEVQGAEDKLNSRFELVKWRLFELQVNGGWKNTCIPLLNGVPYASVNSAQKIDMGIDIINTISKEKGLSYPVFIDDAESSNEIHKPVGQGIYLYVSNDKKLVVKGENDE